MRQLVFSTLYFLAGKTTTTAKNKMTAANFGVWFLIIILLLSGSANFAFGQQLNLPDTRPETRLNDVSDNRVMVADTSKFPFSAVVKIIATFPNGNRATGSGALIGPDKVLTADHVVYNEEWGGDAKVIEILPGYANNYTTCKRTYAKTMKHGSHQGCHDGANCDVAVLTTTESMGCDTGWFGYKQYSQANLNDVFIAGYPADLNNGQNMYFVNTKATHLENFSQHNILRYLDWTFGGMSGGPIFTSDYYIVGIHTNGGSEANYGVAICNQLFSAIKDWTEN
jgi:V8-like Glu-specific endopeptidase